MDASKISFSKANVENINVVKEWFEKPYIQEWWGTCDYSYNNFYDYVLYDKKVLFDHWIAYYRSEPYAYLVTSDASDETPLDYYAVEHSAEMNVPNHYIPFLEPDRATYTLDFFIGNENFLGIGFAVPTLILFRDYLGKCGDAFLIDPECDNVKAIHVYEKAGFKIVNQYEALEGEFKGKKHFLMKWVMK